MNTSCHFLYTEAWILYTVHDLSVRLISRQVRNAWYHYDNLRAENGENNFHLQDGRDYKVTEYLLKMLHLLLHASFPQLDDHPRTIFSLLWKYLLCT